MMVALDELYAVLRRAGRRLAGPRGWVRAFVYTGEGGLTVNELHGEKLQHERLEDYRTIHPDWLAPVGGKVRIHLKVEYDRSSRHAKVFLDGQGTWEDEACSVPFFKCTTGNPSLREAAIAKLGEERVIEAEKVIRDAVGQLLTAPALKKAGFSWRRGVAPEIVFRWKAGTSRGGKRGLSFAMLRHAMKPEQGAVYKEYSRLNAFPGIGDFTGSRVDCLRVLAAHELAHWLQYEPKVRRPEWDFKPPHGEGFRRLYRILWEALSSMDGQR